MTTTNEQNLIDKICSLRDALENMAEDECLPDDSYADGLAIASHLLTELMLEHQGDTELFNDDWLAANDPCFDDEDDKSEQEQYLQDAYSSIARESS